MRRNGSRGPSRRWMLPYRMDQEDCSMADPVDQSLTLRLWTDVVRRARLGRTTKAVALMLATYADNDGSRVFPGVARLAVDCELTYNVIQTALKSLRAAGLIEVVRKAVRRRHADEYRLILADDVLDRIDVLTPAQIADAAEVLATQRRGRPRPAAKRRIDEVLPATEQAPHPGTPGAGDTDGQGLHPTASGAASSAAPPAAPHGDVHAASPAPHGDVQLHPTALPPTVHGPIHHSHHPSDNAVRADLAVVAAGDEPMSDALHVRCVHGLDGRTGLRCPACGRGLGAGGSDAGASRPTLRLVRSA